MVKKLLIHLMQLLILVCCVNQALAQSTPASVVRPAKSHQKVKLSAQQVRTIEAVQGKRLYGTFPMRSNSFGRFTANTMGILKSGILKSNKSGSTLQGLRLSSDGNDNGWFEVKTDGTQDLLWKYKDGEVDEYGDPIQFPFNAGFLRKGKVYASASYLIFNWVVNAHGVFTTDGEITEYTEDENLSDDLSQYILSCAYDETNDVAYTYTLNTAGSGYMLRSFNPETWQFSTINDNVPLEDVCIALTWVPVTDKLLGITMDQRLVEIDKTTGSYTQKKKFDLPITYDIAAFTYSPLDKKIALVYPPENSSQPDPAEISSQLYFLDPFTYDLEYLADLKNTKQYKILVCADKAVADNAPAAPYINNISFEDASLSGTINVTLPSKTFSGADINDKILLTVYVDGKENTHIEGQAGETVDVAVSGLTNGMHKLSCAATINGEQGPSVDKNIFTGYDTPVTPTNVKLQSGKVTWDAVTKGVNGGFIDCANITYNVYLNGKKINTTPVSGESFDFNMPDGKYSLYMAAVEAVNHGYASTLGYSGNIKDGAAFPLPYTITPTESEAALTSVQTSYLPETYSWRFSSDESAFTSYISTWTKMNNWLFLPPVSVDDTEKLVEVSFKIKSSYDDAFENIDVAYGTDADSLAMNTIKRIENFNNTEYTTYKVWFAASNPGTYYIGFNNYTNPDGSLLYLKDISIKMSDRPVTTPKECSVVSTEPLPKGELKARVRVKLPELTVGGNIMDANTTLTATIKSSVATATATGHPGETVEADVATVQGDNTISLSASVNGIEGLEATTHVYTGIDIPEPISKMTVTTSEDYKKMHIEWDAPTKGINGGYVDPQKVTYSLAVKDENGEWTLGKSLGTNRTYDYTTSVTDGMAYESIGIVAESSLGNCGTFHTANAVLGTPYSLPMDEFMNSEYGKYVEYSSLRYDPVRLEAPTDEYGNSAGYIGNPSSMLIDAPTDNGALVGFGEKGSKERMALPAFSTEGCTNVGIEMEIYCGKNAAETNIYALAYGKELLKIASIHDTENKGWKRLRFMLPKEYNNKKWVELKFDFIHSEDEQYAAIKYYRIHDFKENDMELAGAGTQEYGIVGKKQTITATIENIGTETQNIPEVVCDITTKSGKKLASLPMKPETENAQVAATGEMTYTADWCPTADAIGEVDLTMRIATPDMNSDNDQYAITTEIGKGRDFIVSDLRAQSGKTSGVNLTWTEPQIQNGVEDFEDYSAFSYDDTIGEFRNIDRDKAELTYFGYYNFPHQGTPKAWQVISAERMKEIIANAGYDTEMPAKSGDKYLMAMNAAGDISTDDWLVSPELQPGSKISFYLAGCNTYNAYVEFLTSATPELDDFTLLDKATLFTEDWKPFSYTLPEGAKYFAIRYVGKNDSFYCLLDDINYVPVNSIGTLAGYDIYRNGSLIAKKQPVGGCYTDTHTGVEGDEYYIIPVILRNGTEATGTMSNTARLNELSGIIDVKATDDNANATYYTLQGIRAVRPHHGVYIHGNKKIAIR